MQANYDSKVRDGMDVYDVNEEKLGTVQEVYDASPNESNSGGRYLRVPTGFLGMGTEHHIPTSAIEDVRDERIYLSVDKDHLDEFGYGDAAHQASNEEFDGTTVERTATTTTMQDVATSDGRSSRAPAEDARTLQLREEELVARKQTVETGAVELRTDVVSEERTLQVPVTREEVTIDRHAVDRRPSDRPIGESETVSVPVHQDELTLEKKAVVYEEVNLGKRSVQETKQLTDTVRREEAVIDKDGGIEVADGEARPTPRQP
jgi:uncharacterized protein (TIGR02271 family)